MRDWDAYFMELAEHVADRATCSRLRVGAILVKDKRIIATGYNGSVSGETHCIDDGCKIRDSHCIRTIHAEQNALLQCAKFGVATEGATIYVTHFPCLYCTKSLIQAGISKVVYLNDYRNDDYAIDLLIKTHVQVYKLHDNGFLENMRITWVTKNKPTSWSSSMARHWRKEKDDTITATFSDSIEYGDSHDD